MSRDNLVYVQRCADGKWRAWEQGASVDPQRPGRGFIVETKSRTTAIVKAHDWQQTNATEYGVYELDPEEAAAPMKNPPTPEGAGGQSR